MIQFGDFPELITNNICEENKEFNILDDSNIFQFTENFKKIFPVNQINELNIDNESEYIIKDKENQKIYLNINENKSKQKISNIEDNLSKFHSLLDSNNRIYCNKYSFNNNILRENKDNNIIIPQIENIKLKKVNENNLLCKKRKIFDISYTGNFKIFNSGIYNQSSRKIIDEVRENEANKMKKVANLKFKTQKKSNKKKLKNIIKRKENADNIRKKIKARFLKDLRNAVNKRLEIAGSYYFFKLLPQAFITNVSKEKNKSILDLTFKEIFSINFCEKGKENGPDLKKYQHNLAVINYLEKNNNIGDNSNFNSFKNMTFNQIFEEYLKSKEFEIEIASLKKEKESENYIKNYIIKASNLMQFFAN